MHPRGLLEAEQLGQRRHQIDQADTLPHYPTARQSTRRMEDQRYPEGLVVAQESVPLLDVLAERLAVIGGDHDQSVVQQIRRLQILENPADLRVDEGDLPVVRVGGEAISVPGRRAVGKVRIVEMEPAEEPTVTGLVEPTLEPAPSSRAAAVGPGSVPFDPCSRPRRSLPSSVSPRCRSADSRAR